MQNLILVDKEVKLTLDTVQEIAGGRPALVLDANIKDIEKLGTDITYGFLAGNILNIDHHFPVPTFSRRVSTTNLAIAYVQEHGPLSSEYMVIINHTDCDSVLAVLIMTGVLAPEARFGEAAIAADHTGDKNEIADILQALDEARDFDFSVRNLQLVLEGEDIEGEAVTLLMKRVMDRCRATEMAKSFDYSGQIAFTATNAHIDGGLLPALLPEASIIVIMGPEMAPGIKEVKVRLGVNTPSGTDLRPIMAKVDPHFGGRWNAGANKRQGGTTMSLDEYISKLAAAI